MQMKEFQAEANTKSFLKYVYICIFIYVYIHKKENNEYMSHSHLTPSQWEDPIYYCSIS